MRIGIDARGIYKYLDGVGRYSLNLIRHLAKIDQANEYIIIRNRVFEKSIVEAPNFREVLADFPHLSLRTGFCLGHILQKERLDLFHSLFPIAPMYGLRNLIITVHDLMALKFPGFFSDRNILAQKASYFFHTGMIRSAVMRSKRIIAVSRNTKEDVVELFGTAPAQIAVIYEAADPRFRKIRDTAILKRFRESLGLPEKFVLYLGNMKPYKNLLFLIKGFDLFRARWNLEYQLVIAGKRERFYKKRDKYGEELRQSIDRLNLQGCVQFVDYLPEEDLPLLYNSADLFVFPSLYEGFGLPALEAISCGTATIVSKASSLPEVVGNAALLIDPHDAEELAHAIHRILTDKELSHSLSENGLVQSRKFSWEKTAMETLEVYGEAALGA